MSRLLFIGLLLSLAAVIVAAEDKEAVESLNLGVAVMLLGSVAFMMGVFYLVNHSDKDMQLYTWQTICATISIFAAVLVFQAVNGIVKDMFLKNASGYMTVAVATIHACIWYGIMQVFLALVSGAVSFPWQTPNKELFGEEKKKAQDQLLLNMKCWGILLGHISGFATINAWAEVQQFFKHSVLLCFLVPCVAAFGLFCVYKVLDVLRYKSAKSDDGIEDEFEKLWDEATEETEDDVMSLTVSFLLVQAIRFAIIGVLPDTEGELPKDAPVSDLKGVLMLVIGFAFGVILFLRTVFFSVSIGRFTTWIRLIFDMVAAWAIMFAIETLLAIHHLGGSEMGALGEVIQATVVTVFSFTIIYFLDKEADIMSTRSNGKKVQRAVQSLIIALGVLVGFSWEKCFDVAVDSAAEQILLPDVLVKFFLAITLSVIVIPAWRWYILPVVKELGGFDEEEEILEEGPEVPAYVPPKLDAKDLAHQAELESARGELARMSRRHAESQQRVAELEKTVHEQKMRMERQSRPSMATSPPMHPAFSSPLNGSVRSISQLSTASPPSLSSHGPVRHLPLSPSFHRGTHQTNLRVGQPAAYRSPHPSYVTRSAR